MEGISRIFLCIDMTGAVLSTIALALTSDFQPISAACYIGVFVLDGGIMFLSFIIPARPKDTIPILDNGAN